MVNKTVNNVQLKPLGDAAVSVQFGTEIDPSINKKVKALAAKLSHTSFPGFVECTPAFASLTVFYDPFRVWQAHKEKEISPYLLVCAFLEQIINTLDKTEDEAFKVVEIPVCYGGEFGPDLDFVAAHNHLSPDEVVCLHTSVHYPVYMIGFAPGFPYLGGLSEKLHAPRRSSPRASIPAGSVGIAGSQTGVYPISTPGGWQLIGRTPMVLFQPDCEQPSILAAGDQVKFVSITKKEYTRYQERLQ